MLVTARDIILLAFACLYHPSKCKLHVVYRSGSGRYDHSAFRYNPSQHST